MNTSTLSTRATRRAAVAAALLGIAGLALAQAPAGAPVRVGSTLALTGLTRNGVWLVEDGQVTTPVRNFRFTQGYAQALAPGNVTAIGRTADPIPGDTYTTTSPRWSCPALHIASWNFTGGASG